MNLLVYVEPAALCEQGSDLILAPLPSEKALWEAPSAHAWNLNSQDSPSMDEYGVTKSGDLVKFSEPHRPGCTALARRNADGQPPAMFTAEWHKWFADMDGYGALVMLAASFATSTHGLR